MPVYYLQQYTNGPWIGFGRPNVPGQMQAHRWRLVCQRTDKQRNQIFLNRIFRDCLAATNRNTSESF